MMARLLHRIEYDAASETAVMELGELCTHEGIFYDYLSDFIAEVCVHEEKVRAILRDVLEEI